MAVAGRWLLGAILGALLLSLLVVACGRSDDRTVEVSADGTPVATLTPSRLDPEDLPVATLTPSRLDPEDLPVATLTPSRLDPEDLRGFAQPIEGACFPTSDRLIPNAPREYRNGIHEGVDYYDLAVCVPIGEGTPVVAMYGGVVIRADLAYRDITAQQVNELAAKTALQGFSDEATLDVYRGRQIWIDHGNGVVTRYAHLLEIAGGIDVGVEVRRGQLIGAVGESGTPESISAPGTENHVHVEVRVGDGFLGAERGAPEVRALYERLFGPEEPPTATSE